jgi:hypothetical protein
MACIATSSQVIDGIPLNLRILNFKIARYTSATVRAKLSRAAHVEFGKDDCAGRRQAALFMSHTDRRSP